MCADSTVADLEPFTFIPFSFHHIIVPNIKRYVCMMSGLVWVWLKTNPRTRIVLAVFKNMDNMVDML